MKSNFWLIIPQKVVKYYIKNGINQPNSPSNIMERKIDMQDKELIAQILENKDKGFEMLVKRYQNSVLNIAYSLIGNKHQAEDIAQEVFIKVYKSIETFRGLSKISTWLYRITLNSSYDFLRRRKKFVPLDEYGPIQAPHTSSTDFLERKEKKELVQKAIDGLPFKYRKVVVLKDIENLSYKDIANVLQCRIGTVESRLFRARKMLKNILTPLVTKEALL